MKLEDNERLQEAVADLKSHLRDEYDGPIGAIGFALDEDDADQIEKACDELIDHAIRVRLAAFPEELEKAEKDGPKVVLVSHNGYWAIGSTFWHAIHLLPCTPDLMYVTDDPEPVIYQHGAIGVHEDKTLVKIPLCRDQDDRVSPVAFVHKPHTQPQPKDNE